MNLLKRVGVMIACVAVSCLVLVGLALPALAVDDETPKFRMQVSPSTLNIDLAPGKTVQTTFFVQNTGRETFDFEVVATPFSVSGTEYTQDFETETAYTDLAKWVTFSMDTNTVEPGEEVEVTARVSVPKDVPAGGQYAAAMVKMVKNTSTDGDVGVAVQQQIGLLLYSTVEGQTRREGSILENKVPMFMFQPPISATSLVENTGNVHATATYILQVYPLFSDEEAYTNEERPDKATIMPETQRMNTVYWNNAPSLGIFKVRQTVKFLDDEKVTEKIVFLCPLWFLVIVLVVLFIIIFGIVNRVRGRRE